MKWLFGKSQVIFVEEIRNAKITSTQITMADHGILTFWLNLDGAGWGVGYGGYCIGKGCLGAKEFSAERGEGLEAMMRIMDAVGVDTWEDLTGKLIRVKTVGWGQPVKVIGNILEDKWFDIDEFFKSRQKE